MIGLSKKVILDLIALIGDGDETMGNWCIGEPYRRLDMKAVVFDMITEIVG